MKDDGGDTGVVVEGIDGRGVVGVGVEIEESTAGIVLVAVGVAEEVEGAFEEPLERGSFLIARSAGTTGSALENANRTGTTGCAGEDANTSKLEVKNDGRPVASIGI